MIEPPVQELVDRLNLAADACDDASEHASTVLAAWLTGIAEAIRHAAADEGKEENGD